MRGWWSGRTTSRPPAFLRRSRRRRGGSRSSRRLSRARRGWRCRRLLAAEAHLATHLSPVPVLIPRSRVDHVAARLGRLDLPDVGALLSLVAVDLALLAQGRIVLVVRVARLALPAEPVDPV